MQTETTNKPNAIEALEIVRRDAESKVSDKVERTPTLSQHGHKGRQGDVYYLLRTDVASVNEDLESSQRKSVEVAKSHTLSRADGGQLTVKTSYMVLRGNGSIPRYVVYCKAGDVLLLKHPEHADHRITVAVDGVIAVWPQVNPVTMRQARD